MNAGSSLQLCRMARRGARGLLHLYRAVVSPAIGPACRHIPTCSVYAEQAIEDWGLLKGSYLALRRLLRCHPFSAGGWDPVPPAPAGHPHPRRGL